jgi:drug/metabolite transporter (DMT)-like permease
MSSLALILLAIVVVGNTTGQLLFKGASMRADRAEAGGMPHWQSLATDPLLWLAISLYVVEFFIWLAFLSVVPLWQGVMVACVDILLVMIGGRVFFGEHLTPARIGAICLIAIGVMLVGAGGNGP